MLALNPPPSNLKPAATRTCLDTAWKTQTCGASHGCETRISLSIIYLRLGLEIGFMWFWGVSHLRSGRSFRWSSERYPALTFIVGLRRHWRPGQVGRGVGAGDRADSEVVGAVRTAGQGGRGWAATSCLPGSWRAREPPGAKVCCVPRVGAFRDPRRTRVCTRPSHGALWRGPLAQRGSSGVPAGDRSWWGRRPRGLRRLRFGIEV